MVPWEAGSTLYSDEKTAEEPPGAWEIKSSPLAREGAAFGVPAGLPSGWVEDGAASACLALRGRLHCRCSVPRQLRQYLNEQSQERV